MWRESTRPNRRAKPGCLGRQHGLSDSVGTHRVLHSSSGLATVSRDAYSLPVHSIMTQWWSRTRSRKLWKSACLPNAQGVSGLAPAFRFSPMSVAQGVTLREAHPGTETDTLRATDDAFETVVEQCPPTGRADTPARSARGAALRPQAPVDARPRAKWPLERTEHAARGSRHLRPTLAEGATRAGRPDRA